jgi:hypothetical protein
VSAGALEILAEEGVMVERRGQAAIVAGKPEDKQLPLTRK